MEIKFDDEISKSIRKLFESFTKKPILFIGSGLMRRYFNSPNWENLLKTVAGKISNNQFYYPKIHSQALSVINSDEQNELFPKIAELLSRDYNSKFFSESTFETELKVKYKNQILDNISPFKLAIAELTSFDIKNATPTYVEEIKYFEQLHDKVSNIITTNYDGFLESNFSKYNVLIGQDDLFNKTISSVGNVFKIHGSSSMPESIVIDYTDYSRFRNKQKFLSAKLLTFMLEYPVIFIGYSIRDSNILSILSDISSCLNQKNKEELSKRLLFIERVDDESKECILSTTINDIMMTKIELHDYNKLYSSFKDTHTTIDVKSLRALEKLIVQLVQSNNPNIDRLYAINADNSSIDDNKLAVYIGHESSVFEKGYSAIKLINLCEDVIFSTKHYDANFIIDTTIPQQKSYFANSKIPLYKYLKDYKKGIGNLDSWIDNKIIKSIDDLYSLSVRKTNTVYRNPYNSIEDIINHAGFVAKDIKSLGTVLNNILFSIKNLDINKVENFIKEHWNDAMQANKTALTKIVCAIDFKKNK